MTAHGCASAAAVVSALCLSSCANQTTAPIATGVQGTVMDAWGRPVPGVFVVVSGNDPVTTDAQGSFSFADVGSPFDLTVVDHIAPSVDVVRMYVGLTRRRVRIFDYVWDAGTVASATISGFVPVSPGKVTRVYHSHSNRFALLDPSTGQYFIHVLWDTPPARLHGSLLVLRTIVDPQSRTQEYDGFAYRPLDMDDGAAIVGQNFLERELDDPPDRHLSGSVNRGPEHPLVQVSLDLAFQGATLTIDTQYPLATDRFDFVVPGLEGASFSLFVGATDAEGGGSMAFRYGLAAGANDVVVELQAAPLLVSPPADAPNVDVATPFEWGPASDSGVHLLKVYPDTPPDTVAASTSALRFEIYVHGTSARLPDLASHGWGLRAGGSYRWSVEWRSFPLVIDDLVSPTPIEFPEDTPLLFQGSSSPSWLFHTRTDSIVG